MLKSIGWVMVVVLPMSSALAQTGGAMLYMSGAVRVNGLQVSRNTAVFEGDTVETQANPASINARGASITLAANSKLGYSKDVLQLSHGSAGFRTEKGLQVQAGDVSVATKQNVGQFAVENGKQGVRVAALSGAVIVTSPRGVTEVAAGSKLALTSAMVKPQNDPPSTPAPSAQSDWDDSKAGFLVGVTSAVAAAAIILVSVSKRQNPASAFLP